MIHRIRLVVALVACLAVLCMSALAFAQVAPTPPAAPALSTGIVVVTLLSLLAGVVTQAQQSGKFFGQFAIPSPAMVVLTLVAPFLGGSLAYLQSVSFSGNAIFFAVVAGVSAVLAASAPGLAVHASFVVPAHVASIRTSRLAGTIVKGVGVLGILLGVGAGGAVLTSAEACTPAQVATLNADAQLAASILTTLQPVACGIVDAVDPANATAICEVVTDITKGVTVLVPITGSIAALTQVVQTKPADATVAAAVVATKAALAASHAAVRR